MEARIMLVEDEMAMQVALKDTLESAGYRTIQAMDGEKALDAIMEQKPDLILLDVMMPRVDGFSVCKEIRRLGVSIPVIFISAKGMVEDRVHGLDAGADDYLVKPFHSKELLARVRAQLRKNIRETKSLPDKINIGRLQLQLSKNVAKQDGNEIHLTQKEWEMIKFMIEDVGKVISRERFLDLVWGVNSFPTTRTVDNHIASLRSKIEPDPSDPRFIKTVHGKGYRLDLDDHFANV